MIKYIVQYYESEAGWGSKTWITEYNSENEARAAAKDCNDKYMFKSTTPSYYVKATYIGEKE